MLPLFENYNEPGLDLSVIKRLKDSGYDFVSQADMLDTNSGDAMVFKSDALMIIVDSIRGIPQATVTHQDTGVSVLYRPYGATKHAVDKCIDQPQRIVAAFNKSTVTPDSPKDYIANKIMGAVHAMYPGLIVSHM